MTPLGTLLAEIWLKDNTFYIEQDAYSQDVKMCNRPNDDSTVIEVKTNNLGQTIQRVWSLCYMKERAVNDTV